MKRNVNIHQTGHRGHQRIVALPAWKLSAHPEVPALLLSGLLVWLLKVLLSNVWVEGVGGTGVWALFG